MITVDIEKMNLIELKALAYDIMLGIQNDQRALQEVNKKIEDIKKSETMRTDL